MKFFEAEAAINAPANVIWEILTDAQGYPEWEPNILRIEGKIAPGESIKVFTKLSPDRAFPVTVTDFVPNQHMTWSSSMPLGLFKGQRTFKLHPMGNVISFTTREEFSGLLLPVFSRQIGNLQPAFDTFVSSLKTKAESVAAS